ncbi:MAG TPA: patatin-like phospholipase family protein [bacterium]|jgi:NTE family protein
MTRESIKIDPELGICLAGAGGLAYLHIGLFEALEELHLRPGVVAGTSSGAVLGAFYASGMTSKEIRTLLRGFNWTSVMTPTIPTRGLMSTRRLEHFLVKVLGNVNIEDLPIKLKVAAVDLHSGELAGFTEGPLARHVAASCAVPGMFNPVMVNDRTYYDAGGIYNLPLELMSGENLKAIIAGNTIGRAGLQKNPKTLQEIYYQAYLIRSMRLTIWRAEVFGWEGRNNEQLCFIDYPTHGKNPTKLDDMKVVIHNVKKLAVSQIRKDLKAWIRK